MIVEPDEHRLGRRESEGFPPPPVIEELSPPPDPIEAFAKLASLPWSLFLDSAASDPEHGRYSYILGDPYEVITTRGHAADLSSVPVDVEGRGRTATREERRADPFDLLEERLGRWRAKRVPGLPPFQGGAGGLFSYGLSRMVERLPAPRHDEFRVPDLAVGLYDLILAFDHREGTAHVISHGFPAPPGRARESRARRRARSLVERLRTGEAADRVPAGPRENELSRAALAPHWPLEGSRDLFSNFRREDYIAAVRRTIDYIHAGDVFQVNLSQRLLHRLECSPLDFYLRLRERNPAPFAGYFRPGEHVIASSSPEQFLSLSDGHVVTRPIKGTRGRGYTPEEDSYRGADLRLSEKDRSENVMIVDLLRNDLSRVARPGTVTVPRLFDLERHPTVHHLVSEVRARLRDDANAIDLLRATFPGGSVTGAPKVRAMEIIAELEPTARGAYCGSLGWISFAGDLGTSILIRTVTIGRGWMQLPVGGGIVADSRPEDEYRETLDKAAGMVRAIR